MDANEFYENKRGFIFPFSLSHISLLASKNADGMSQVVVY